VNYLSGVPVDSDVVSVVLEGGPPDLPSTWRTQSVAGGEEKIKIMHRGGYEHFERDGDVARADRADRGARVIFRWTMRTRIAE
jgi:hypothetical protein